jgi:hypothetical protein
VPLWHRAYIVGYLLLSRSCRQPPSRCQSVAGTPTYYYDDDSASNHARRRARVPRASRNDSGSHCLASAGSHIRHSDRHWFGKRWTGFAGKVAGSAGVVFCDDFVVPPFVPNRVVDQTCYERSDAGEYVAVDSGTLIHLAQPSRDNLKRKVSTLFPDAALLWFSSNSKTNVRGTILAYVPSSRGHEAWFAEFRGVPTWHPTELVGITASELHTS